jgi:hypothetical protein
MKNHNVGSRQFRRRLPGFSATLLLNSVGLCCIIFSGSGTAAEPDMDQMFDIIEAPSAVDVAIKGNKNKRHYAVQKTKTDHSVALTLTESGKQGSKFSYDETAQSIGVEQGPKKLAIAVQGENVSIGGIKCSGSDAACIADAVSAELPDLSAEDVAAAFIALRSDMGGAVHGGYISDAMAALADALTKSKGNI